MNFDIVIKDENSYQEFLTFLKSISKAETIEDHERHVAIINTKQEVICISMANIRKIAKTISKTSAEKFLNISQAKDYKDQIFEETLIEGIVIAQLKNVNDQIERFKKWVYKIDNWATCDSVVSSLKILKNKPSEEFYGFFRDLCFSAHEFVSRFGIVVLMTIYLNAAHIDDILDICRLVKSEQFYVNMALAWLLSYTYVKFKEKTTNLFKEKCLSKFVQNKAISKCRDSFRVSKEDKEVLKGYRVK